MWYSFSPIEVWFSSMIGFDHRSVLALWPNSSQRSTVRVAKDRADAVTEQISNDFLCTQSRLARTIVKDVH
jgi:hypothetical protein